MYLSIHPSMHPSIRPFVRPSTPLSIHDSHANALSCQIIQTALNEVDIRWYIWWIFDGYLFAFLLNSESSGRGAPTFAAKLGSVCADLGSLPDRLTACLLAANVPVKQLLSQKKQATSTCSANLSHTKLMLSLEFLEISNVIAAFRHSENTGRYSWYLLISGLMRQCLRKRDHSPRLKSPEQELTELTELTQLTPWHGTCGTGPGSA